MMNKTGIAGVVFACLAAGLGFAAYFVSAWATDGDAHLNIEQACDDVNGLWTCIDHEETTRMKFNKYLQLAVGPGLAFFAALIHLIKLCCGTNCCSFFAAFKAFMSCGAYAASVILFSNEHFWESGTYDDYTISYGLIMAPVAAIFSFVAAILMIVSGVQTRNQFGGKVMDAMQIKHQQTRVTGVTPRQPRTGRRV